MSSICFLSHFSSLVGASALHIQPHLRTRSYSNRLTPSAVSVRCLSQRDQATPSRDSEFLSLEKVVFHEDEAFSGANGSKSIGRRGVIFSGIAAFSLINSQALATELLSDEDGNELVQLFDSETNSIIRVDSTISPLSDEGLLYDDGSNVESGMNDVAATDNEMDAQNFSGDSRITRRVYFDVSIDGEPAGRIVIGLYGEDVPIGAARFAEIAIGKRGVSYRKREFTKITPSYIQNAGVRNFSLTGNGSDAANFTGGETADALVEEMAMLENGFELKRHTSSVHSHENQPLAWNGRNLKNVAGSVSLVAIDPSVPKPKQKLIARGGQLEYVEEISRPPPNGSSFVIATNDSPELDGLNLVVGKVIDGFDVVEAISKVPTVKENTSSPYFKTAKLIGDTRAVVAERGFNRPYSKIVITKCGEI